MKVQIEQIDLLQPIPRLTLRLEYAYMRVVLSLGTQPFAQMDLRPRGRTIRPTSFLRRVAKMHGFEVMRSLIGAGLRTKAYLDFPATRELMPDEDPLHRFQEDWPTWLQFLREKVLSPKGLQSPYRDWVLADEARLANESSGRRWPRVTVIVCTADRAPHIGPCIDALKHLDYDDFEILIADNSRDPGPTQEVVQRAGVRYLRVPQRGLSFARNAAIEAARAPWVAFTDDDCRPHRNWLRELVRPTLERPSCMAVTGLVVPAQLESDAELTFETYGGLGRGFYPKCFNRVWLRNNRFKPARTWDIGAGANMLLRRSAVRAMGGFDVDLGAGRPAGCSEDTDIYYQILRHGSTIEYTPRAIVDHYHRCDADSLRKQIHNYAKGHAAYHLRCLVKYRDHRSLCWLIYFLPHSLSERLRYSLRGWSTYPATLVGYEMHGTLVGPWLYAGAKLRRAIDRCFGLAKPPQRAASQAPAEAA